MRITSSLRILIATSLLLATSQGMAQWKWKDNNGRTVFSDRPPPSSVPLKNIIKQPGVATPVAVSVSNTSTRILPKKGEVKKQAGDTNGAKKLSPKEQAAAAKKAKEEEAKKREESKKVLAEKEQEKKAKAENCRRARSALATLKSNPRIATVNDKGERTVMDDAARQAERKRLKKVADSNCSS